MIRRSEYAIGDFLYEISDKEYYKDTPSEEMVFIHNGYMSGDGYGILIGFVDGKVKKSTGWNNFMWGGKVRLATDEEKEKFINNVMNSDKITDY